MNTIKSFIIIAVLALTPLVAAPVTSAIPPGPTNCGGSDQPQCLPGIDSPTECAIVAWRTHRPCNWFGVPVAPGTPGSW